MRLKVSRSDRFFSRHFGVNSAKLRMGGAVEVGGIASTFVVELLVVVDLVGLREDEFMDLSTPLLLIRSRLDKLLSPA